MKKKQLIAWTYALLTAYRKVPTSIILMLIFASIAELVKLPVQ
ncbi:hypothetical protein J2Z66_001518 [Paenibacillus eucommiae]|uniref:ABC transporter ATP-binding protein n=1 Tax=Paenibacillus eucommiae TaxID=1355755 RepID=A0ABS4IS11_9BACL|nr:hypothetical protein [Paenibacillus eucommiae]